MKSLNLTRPLVLMVVGHPGAGKSFFARQFSETFNAPVVSFDRIRFELFANPTFSNDENDLVGRVASYMIEELFKSHRTLIVDGGCNSKVERTKLGQAAKEAGYDTTVVWVQTDINTSKNRALKRNGDKRVDDRFNRSVNESTFETLAKRFTEPTRENYVVISGKHTYNTQAKMVLRKLVVAREAEAHAAHRQGIEQTKQSTGRSDNLRRSVIIRQD
jgi:predicted kinase